jgi:hypothetical protein
MYMFTLVFISFPSCVSFVMHFVPVTHDPGWNDPPVVSYDAVTATAQSKTPKRGLLLNKRVAFPLSSQSPSGMPPTTNSMLPAMPASNIGSGLMMGLPPIADHPTTARNTTEENARQSLQKEDALQRVMEGFEQILKDSAHDFQVCLLLSYNRFYQVLFHFRAVICLCLQQREYQLLRLK